jgi:hypothetical protein
MRSLAHSPCELWHFLRDNKKLQKVLAESLKDITTMSRIAGGVGSEVMISEFYNAAMWISKMKYSVSFPVFLKL